MMAYIRGYIGLSWDNIGIMEEEMETTLTTAVAIGLCVLSSSVAGDSLRMTHMHHAILKGSFLFFFSIIPIYPYMSPYITHYKPR